jgi:glycosyltransferase involved in cell wall biosynthesis
MRRIVALAPNVPGTAPGQRVRIESWIPRLADYGWSVDLYTFENARLREVLYQPGHYAEKAARMFECYREQLRRVRALPPCDVVLVYREAALVGPALLERLVARRGVPIVFDLDEPIFLPYRSPTSGWASLLKVSRKTHALFRMATEIISINRIIGEYAARYNPAVTVVPNFVDVEHYHPAEPSDAGGGPVWLAWSGSHTTMGNLRRILPALQRLQQEVRAPVRVVGTGSVELPGIDYELRQWSAETEVRDLQDCHVGLVPLTDLRWNRWKFYMKVVQYMAVGLPVVAQRMGSNPEVIQHGVNGFLVETQDEWYEALKTLVGDKELRRRMGTAARATAVDQYSTRAQMARVAEVFDRSARAGAK